MASKKGQWATAFHNRRCARMVGETMRGVEAGAFRGPHQSIWVRP